LFARAGWVGAGKGQPVPSQVVYGMPRAVHEAGAGDRRGRIESMAEAILHNIY